MADRSVVVRLKADVDNFRKGMADASDASDKTRKKFDGMQQAGLGLAAVGGVIVAGVGMAIKAYADFDKQMSHVQAATHASAGEMDQLRAAAIQAGADTAFSAEEAAKGIEELSKAGVSTKDILGGGLTGALSLAAAGEMSVGDAAELAATALTQFKLSGSEVPHVADLLAAGAGKAQGSVGDLGYALKQGGLVASQYGLTIEETVGGLAAFASAGLIGSDAGTSFKTMLQSLTPTSKQAQAKMEELGFSAFDANGKFKGLTVVADNLQQSMKDLTPQQRNAAMSIIFGSDAVRAASVLYENGAKGIQEWINNVNDAGYAALTASMNQNNLAGDFEKLSGSIDSVFLKSASGANDVLRGLAQRANDLVGAIGSIPGPILNAGLGITGLVGVLTLLGGLILTTIPKIAQVKSAWDEFSKSNEKASGALKTTGKVAGIAAAALTGLQIAAALVGDGFDKSKGTVDAWNNALLKMDKGKFDEQFTGIAGDVKGVGDALGRLGNMQWYDTVNQFLGNALGTGSVIGELRRNTDGLAQSMAGLVDNGGLARAGQAFVGLRMEADKAAKAQGRTGMSTKEVLDLLPDYKSSLERLATSVGYQATESDLLVLATGKIPPAMQAAADANGKSAQMQQIQKGVSEDQAKALADLGLNVDGTVASFGKLLDMMFATGLAQISATQAQSDWEATLDDLKGKIDGVIASQTAHNRILNDTKTQFDLTNPAGRGAADVFDTLAQKGISATQAMANAGAAQPELQTQLRATFDNLVATGIRFGMSGDAADAMARKVLNIPPGADVNTAIINYADSMAKLNGVQQKANEVNGTKVVVDIQTWDRTFKQLINLPPEGIPADSPVLRPPGKAMGGIIPEYRAFGGLVGSMYLMRPNGTDTQPVMATPGEFMIKRDSARSIGYEELAYANATGRLPNSGRGAEVNISYGNVQVTDLDALMRKQDMARRDALATIGVP